MSALTKFTSLNKKLTASGLAASSSRAHELIVAGHVTVNGAVITSPNCPVTADHKIELVGVNNSWVSPRTEILNNFIAKINIDCKGRTALTLEQGAGGFTESLIFHHCKAVFILSHHPEQLASSLLLNARCKVVDKTIPDFDLLAYDLDVERLEKLLPEMINHKPADLLLSLKTDKKIVKSIETKLKLDHSYQTRKTIDISSAEQPEFMLWAQKI